MYGAYVLFPYSNEEEYTKHRFYQSIDEVNIGGLPFLPNHTTLVSQLIDEIITETPESSFERNILVQGTEEFFERKKPKMNVLVGSIRRRRYDQLAICLTRHFYHIPLSRIQKQLGRIEYVALYQQRGNRLERGGVQYYGPVVDFEIVKRKDIPEVPAPRPEQAEILYVKFKIEKWHKKEPIIRPKGYGLTYHIVSSWDLFQQAVELPELTMRSEEQFRLWRELRRIEQRVETHVKNKVLDHVDTNDLEFHIGNVQLKVDLEKEQVLIKGDKETNKEFAAVDEKDNKEHKGIEYVALQDLKRRPKKIMNLINRMRE